MKLSKFNSIDMLLQDPFFAKSILMNMFNHVNPDTIKDQDPLLWSFLMQMFGEEGAEMEGNWIIPYDAYEYMTMLLEETHIPGDRLN